MITVVMLALAAPPGFPTPEPTKASEPVAKAYSPEKAAAYLDGVGVGWTRERKCVTCHTNLPYLMARPKLAGDDGWKEVRKFLENDVASWSSGGKPRGMTLDELETYIQRTGDVSPVHYLADKYLRDPAVAQQEALAKLASLAEALPGLMAAAGLTTAKGKGRA